MSNHQWRRCEGCGLTFWPQIDDMNTSPRECDVCLKLGSRSLVKLIRNH